MATPVSEAEETDRVVGDPHRTVGWEGRKDPHAHTCSQPGGAGQHRGAPHAAGSQRAAGEGEDGARLGSAGSDSGPTCVTLLVLFCEKTGAYRPYD